MKMTKAQRHARDKAIQQASIAALRTYFTGDGAARRGLLFLRGALLSSAGWTAKFVFLASWAVIGGLLAGPQHDFFLMQVHEWMVATPVDQVLAQTHAMALSSALTCAKIGIIAGFGQKLLGVVKPSIQEAKRQLSLA